MFTGIVHSTSAKWPGRSGSGCSSSRLRRRGWPGELIILLDRGALDESAEQKCLWNAIPDAPSPRAW